MSTTNKAKNITTRVKGTLKAAASEVSNGENLSAEARTTK